MDLNKSKIFENKIEYRNNHIYTTFIASNYGGNCAIPNALTRIQSDLSFFSNF